MTEVHEQMSRIADAVIKCTQEVERLRRDVNRLANKWVDGSIPEEVDIDYFPGEKIRKLTDAFDALKQIKDKVLGCEHHLNRVRSVFDNIDAAVVPREQMRKYLKDIKEWYGAED